MILDEITPGTRNVVEIYDHIKALAELNANEYKEVKNERGHTFSLDDYASQIRGLIRCFVGIEKLDIEFYPKNELHSLSETISQVEQFFNNLNSPDFSESNLNSIEHELPRIHEAAYSVMRNIRRHSILPDDSRIQQLVKDAQAKVKDIGAMKTDSEKLLQKLQDESNKQGVSEEARPFNREAERLGRSKKLWGWLLVASIILIIAVGYTLFAGNEIQEENVSLTLSHLFARLSVLGALWYASLFCSRNYRAAAHGKIINERCRNALESFEKFVAGTSDPAVKDTILQRATETIFSHQTTGFGQRETVEPNSMLPPLLGGFADRG